MSATGKSEILALVADSELPRRRVLRELEITQEHLLSLAKEAG